MTARSIKRPAPTTPTSIEDQARQIRTARQHADAAQADAAAALDTMLADFVAEPTPKRAQAYADAFASLSAMTDLALQLAAHEAEIAEVLERHRAAEADAPRRAAAVAKAEEQNRIWQHPANAERILIEEIHRQTSAFTMGVSTNMVRITSEQIDAGLGRYVRAGQPGEPAFVVRDAEGFAGFLRAHAQEWLLGAENATNAVHRVLGRDPALTDPTRITVSAAAAYSPGYASPSIGGLRR